MFKKLKSFTPYTYLFFIYGNLAIFLLSFYKVSAGDLGYSYALGSTSVFLILYRLIEEYATTPRKNKKNITKNKASIEENAEKIAALVAEIEELKAAKSNGN